MAYVERKLKIIDWKTAGTKIQGRLLAAQRTKFNDGGVGMRYTFEEQDGTIAVAPGATQLDMRMRPSDVGCLMQVTYVGEDTSRQMGQGRSQPKLFQLLVDTQSKVQQTADDGAPPITDDDIPF